MKFLSKLKLVGFFLLGLILVLFTLSTSVNANANINQLPFYWDSINVEIDVQDNGDMLVTETQKYVFNQEYSNERYRYIPLDKVDDITDTSVSENGKILPSQVGKENNQLWIKWKHGLNPPESHTFKIKYRVIGGLHINSNTAEVYWKAIFSDRSSPIQNAKVIVKLPKSVAGKIKSYTHYPTSIRVSSQKLDDKTIEFIAQEAIPQGELLEVRVAFPNDILNLPQATWQKYQTSTNIRSNPTVRSNTRTGSNPGIGSILISLITFIMFFFLPLYAIFNSIFNPKSSSSSRSSHRSYGPSGGGSGGGGGGGGGG